MSEANNKSCCWSITINNPTPDDLQQWEILKDQKWVRSAEGQMEKGEEGTPHLQGMVKTLSVRFSQIKRALPRAHIEAARNVAALTKYVSKEETRVSALPAVRVATQSDVQKRMTDLTLGQYLAGGGENKREPFYDWLQKVQFSNILKLENTHKSIEYWIDKSVRELILEGFYGVEFVMSNPQVRTAFKKYFAEIVIRQYASPQVLNSQTTSEEPQETSSQSE